MKASGILPTLFLGTAAAILPFLVLSSEKEVVIDPTGERIPYEAAAAKPTGDANFWKQFKESKKRPSQTAEAGKDQRRTEEAAAVMEPPKISPVEDERNPDEVPFEQGGLLVTNVLTGRSVAMAPQKNNGNYQEQIDTNQVIEESAKYLREVVLAEDKYRDYYGKCVNKHELCSFWASETSMQCRINPDYMIRDHYCLLACKQCDKIPEGPGDAVKKCTDTNRVQEVNIGQGDALGKVSSASREEGSRGVQTVVV